MNKRAVATSEAVGCAVIYCAAVLLHFIYPLSGGAALSILFGAVNESVWEHLKIFTAPYIGWALLQLCWVKIPFRRYVVAKCIGLYVMMAAIIGFYYGYTALIGTHIPWVYVASSLLTVIGIQALTYALETADNRLGDYFAPALMLIMLYYLMFFSFTIFPPRTALFRDPVTGGFGILGNMLEKER